MGKVETYRGHFEGSLGKIILSKYERDWDITQ